MKAYALAAAATVTVLASLTSGRWDYARMDRELSDYHFAYYARSAEEIELYLENEMWYRYFGKLGEHDGDFYGLYGKSAEGPTQEFRDALQLSEQPRTAAGSSAEPVGEQAFRCNFDIVTGEDGEMEADIRAYGNGVDIVGTFEQDLRPDGGGYKLLHATCEHSNDACGNDLNYIARIERG